MEDLTYTFVIDQMLSWSGTVEVMRCGFIRSRLAEISAFEIQSADHYFDLLITVSEYSFRAFNKDAEAMYAGDCSFKNTFHYDYSNQINYDFIYSSLKNPLVRSPVYEQYCSVHANEYSGLCLECLERYRIVTRNLIPLLKSLRKDLCSIYFTDVLYDLIRFENRNLYSFITHVVNEFSDGSSFKRFASEFGRKKILKLLKKMNRPFRRIDFKFVLKKYIPLLYSTYVYCSSKQLDCLDRVYDYMVYHGLSMFKTVPSEQVVVGYQINDNYRIDILRTPDVLDFSGDHRFQIASHPLLEGLNFGFYKDRLAAYRNTNSIDNRVKKDLQKKFERFTFSGRSVFTNKLIRSEDAIIIGFLKKSENTFQNFRLDIHVTSLIPNRKMLDALRFINHDKWNFEDNISDLCYTVEDYLQ